MKNVLLIMGISVLLAACSGMRKTGPTNYGSNIIQPVEGEDDEYEITIIDTDFDRWFSINGRPANFYSLSYYEQKNRLYVAAWNEKVGQQAFYNSLYYPFTQYIDYNPATSYGLEVNYKLFWYFKYIEDVYGRRFGFPLS